MATRRLDLVYRLRLDAADRAALDRAAAVEGCSAAEFVRRAARGLPVADTAAREAVVGLRRELNALGSNLNQLVHLAHVGKLDAVAIEAAVADIAAMRDVVVRTLRR